MVLKRKVVKKVSEPDSKTATKVKVSRKSQPTNAVTKGSKRGKDAEKKIGSKKAGQPRAPIKKAVPQSTRKSKEAATSKRGAAQAAAQAPSPKKSKHLVSLAGSRAAGVVAGTLDSGIPAEHQHRALRLDARLALVEPSINSDKYYVLQLLDGGGGGGDHWVWTRWGRTGHGGTGKMEGPMDLAAATALFNKTFHDKTGVRQMPNLQSTAQSFAVLDLQFR